MQMAPGLQQPFGQRLVGGEMQVGEENLVRAKQGVFGRLRFLHLHNQIRLLEHRVVAGFE